MINIASTMTLSSCRPDRLLGKTRVLLMRISKATFNFHATCHGEDPIKNTEEIKIPNVLGGQWEHYKLPPELLENEFDYPVCRDTLGIRWPGYWFRRRFVHVPEMEPELVVPDLTGFELKPYVSYRTNEVYTNPFTAKDLFNATYANQVMQAYQEKKIEEFDVPSTKIDEARLKALQTGSDLFEDHSYDSIGAEMKHVVELPR